MDATRRLIDQLEYPISDVARKLMIATASI